MVFGRDYCVTTAEIGKYWCLCFFFYLFMQSNIKSWKFNSEVEKVLWNHFSPFNFLVSSRTQHNWCPFCVNFRWNCYFIICRLYLSDEQNLCDPLKIIYPVLLHSLFFMSRHAPFFGGASSDDPKELGLTQRIMIAVADLLHNEEKLEIWNYFLPLVCRGLERGYKECDSLFLFF